MLLARALSNSPMPMRRRTYRRRPAAPVRRRFRRVKNNRRNTYVARVPRTTVFPARLVTKLKYSEVVHVAIVGAAGLTDYSFNLNGLYDPNSSGTGHQPYGFDEASALYSRYRVFRCSWHVSFPANTTDTYQACVVPVNGASSFSTSSMSRMSELPMAVSKTVAANGNGVNFRGSIYLPKLNGVRPAEYKNDDRYIGTAGANPAEVMKLHLGFTCETSNLDVYPVVTLVYHAEFIDPNIVAQS